MVSVLIQAKMVSVLILIKILIKTKMVSVLIQAITHIENLRDDDLRKIAILLQKAKRRIVTFVKNRNLYDTDERLQNAWKELKQHRCWYNKTLSSHRELSEIILKKISI